MTAVAFLAVTRRDIYVRKYVWAAVMGYKGIAEVVVALQAFRIAKSIGLEETAKKKINLDP